MCDSENDDYLNKKENGVDDVLLVLATNNASWWR